MDCPWPAPSRARWLRHLGGSVGLAFVVSAMTAGGVLAEVGTFGIGIIVGEPTGIDAKGFIDSDHDHAIEVAVAWSLSGNNELHIQADYLLHRYEVIKVSRGQLPIFFGAGGRLVVREGSNDILGVRIPVGLAYAFDDAPVDVFGEIVPVLNLTPDTDFALEGAIGVRYWF